MTKKKQKVLDKDVEKDVEIKTKTKKKPESLDKDVEIKTKNKKKPEIIIEDLNKNLPDPDLKKSKSRRSNYFVTINTNQKMNRYSKQMEDLNNNLKNTMNDIFNNIDEYIIIKPKNDSFDGNIRKIDISTVNEISNKSGLHNHTSINVLHNSRIALDYGKIRKKVIDDLHLKNIYMFSKIYYNNSMNLKDYMLKQQQDQEY